MKPGGWNIIVFVPAVLVFSFLVPLSCKEEKVVDNNMSGYRALTPKEERVIIHKNTEMPFSGKYNDFFEKGTYRCKRCNVVLFYSDDKFKSSCGWPSFDDEIKGALKRILDPDGKRTEIQCGNCGAHLGHVFEGEGYTAKDIRYCVNSISLVFVPDSVAIDTAKAYFAGGCFWGVEYHFERKDGVISAVSGYMGGTKEKPTYEEVCSGKSGYLEVVEVIYDASKITYEALARFFFEIHDPTQIDGQGPDIGEQYHSVIFYNSDEEMKIALGLIDILKKKGYNVVTKVVPVSKFWKAEDYHQDYYETKKQKPYCHIYKKRF